VSLKPGERIKLYQKNDMGEVHGTGCITNIEYGNELDLYPPASRDWARTYRPSSDVTITIQLDEQRSVGYSPKPTTNPLEKNLPKERTMTYPRAELVRHRETRSTTVYLEVEKDVFQTSVHGDTTGRDPGEEMPMLMTLPDEILGPILEAANDVSRERFALPVFNR
jgi:hypothetical protein